jgi:hypothetical protein
MSCWSGMGGIGGRRWGERVAVRSQETKVRETKVRRSDGPSRVILGFLSVVESFGSEFFDDGFYFGMAFHFSYESQPPGVGPGDYGFVRAVVAFGFAPLDERDVVSEAETQLS